MKPFTIDIEKLDGMQLIHHSIEIQGAMTVRETTAPLEGVHQSSLSMSLEQAATLHGWLSDCLARAQAQGWKPRPR
jgi:hypothetical protein